MQMQGNLVLSALMGKTDAQAKKQKTNGNNLCFPNNCKQEESKEKKPTNEHTHKKMEQNSS